MSIDNLAEDISKKYGKRKNIYYAIGLKTGFAAIKIFEYGMISINQE